MHTSRAGVNVLVVFPPLHGLHSARPDVTVQNRASIMKSPFVDPCAVRKRRVAVVYLHIVAAEATNASSGFSGASHGVR